MNILGISLRKPTFSEITAAAVMAVGCWLAAAGVARASGHALDASEAGALLVVIAWGCIGARIGLSLDRSPRHVAVNMAVCAVLVALYQGAVAIGAA